jgi:hypothetical protein
MTTRRLSTWIAIAGLGAIAQLALGCSFGEINWHDPLKRQFSLAETQRQYTQYVRWSAFDKASRYVDAEARDEFMTWAPSIRDLRFTDYEMNPIEIDEATGEATIEVTYYAYRLNSPIETSVKEVQQWRRQDKTNSWMVTSAFSDLGDTTSRDGEH